VQKPSVYVTWHYVINGTPETAQVGLHFSLGGGEFDPAEELDVLQLGQLEALDTAMEVLMSAASITWSDSLRYTGLKVAALSEVGLYVADPLTFVRPTPLMATSANVTLLQQSICLTWRAQSSFGKGTKGRMYLPATGPNSWNSGEVRMPAQLTQNAATAAATFIKDCNAAFSISPQAPMACIVYGGQPATEAPYHANPIHHVQVGDVVDTQRRRRDQLTENYFTADVP